MVAIKEIEPGDRVFSLNERTGQLEVHSVKSAAQTDVRQTYRVEVDGGRVIYATDNHPILTREGWVNVGDLKAGAEVAVAEALPDAGQSFVPVRPKGTPDDFPETTSPKVAWLFGYAIGGGNLDADGSLLSLVADGDTAAVLAGDDRFPVRGERQGRWGQGRHRQQADDSLAPAQRSGGRSRRPPGSRLGVRSSAGGACGVLARPSRRIARGRADRSPVRRHLRAGRVHRSDRRPRAGSVMPP